MPVYNYKALKEDGSSDIGVIDADTPKEARLKLRVKKLHVTELEQVGAQKEKSKRVIKIPTIFRRKRTQELAMITRQLATLLNSGVPLMGSLTAVIEQVEGKHLKAALMVVRERVSQGATFADALVEQPIYFSELYVNMVRAGEASGNLDAVLGRLADHLQKQSRIQGKVSAALTYPIIMLIVGTGVVAFLLIKVVPKITETLIERRGASALPLPTEILLAISKFTASFWWLFLLGGVALYFLYKYIVSTEKGRLAVDSFLLEIPLVGQLFKKQAISRFAVTFATLLESGLPVLVALDVVKRVVNNKVLANALEEVRKKISEGADIATPLKGSKVFPPVVGYMIAVGEESGRLEELLRKIADAYDEDIEITSQKLTSLLEPMMIVAMAVIVGFIVLSILLPILQMSKIGPGH